MVKSVPCAGAKEGLSRRVCNGILAERTTEIKYGSTASKGDML